MESVASFPDEQIRVNGTVQLSGLEGEDHHHLHSPEPQPSPQPMEVQIATGNMCPVQSQQLTAVAANQQPRLHVELQISELGLNPLSIQAQDSLSGHTSLQTSDPILRMRYLSIMNLVQGAMIGLTYLPGDLQGLHETYRRVMLIMSVGATIAMAVISLFVSFWLALNPDRWINWITGLSAVNGAMLGGPLACWVIARQTGN